MEYSNPKPAYMKLIRTNKKHFAWKQKPCMEYLACRKKSLFGVFVALQGHSLTMSTTTATKTMPVGSEEWEKTRAKVVVEEEQRVPFL